MKREVTFLMDLSDEELKELIPSGRLVLTTYNSKGEAVLEDEETELVRVVDKMPNARTYRIFCHDGCEKVHNSIREVRLCAGGWVNGTEVHVSEVLLP